MLRSLVGSEMCIRDSINAEYGRLPIATMADEEENTGPKYEYDGEKHPEDPTQQHGKGKAVYPNGDEYVGEYEIGKRSGAGVYKWVKMEVDEETGEPKIAMDEDGNKVFESEYTGGYKENMKDGQGKMVFPDGSTYEGSWKYDKRHGDGVYWYSNGDIFSGEWRFGLKHGRGTLISKETGAKLVGTFTEGQFVKGKWVMDDATYTGAYKDNKPHGPGPVSYTHLTLPTKRIV
eukprot:TRINITY_DN495_c0_g2_i1.p1 TRINITY_DN495_c0_g2~~TRINITY_DN495_c0_g2_i1.p1  ORF type:complete len:257 (+),score=78.99 TRINITY_DN495_c0_g2_i1:78-773(+)